MGPHTPLGTTSKYAKLRCGNRFGHYVRLHVLRRAVFQHNLTVFNFLTHEVVANVDVLGALVKFRVLGQRNGTLIVLVDLDRLIALYKTELAQNALSQIASWTAFVNAMYSASVDDSATVRCFLLLQLMHPPFNMKA